MLQELNSEYRNALRSRLSVLPAQAVAWLALAPEWPAELVSLGFPVEGGQMGLGSLPVKMLERASKPPGQADSPGERRPGRFYRQPNPIVEATTANKPWTGDTFRIAAEVRSAVLEDLLEEYTLESAGPRANAGLAYVREQLTEAASVMQRSEKLGAYPTLWRWAQLAVRAQSDDVLRNYLEEQVRTAIAEAESQGRVAAPDALRWIEAAESFAEIFQGKLELSLTLARRRRELFLRRAYDQRMLANYLERRDQLEAFQALLADEDHWALHYVGGGGLGKTMLLRDISRQASKGLNGGFAAVTSRVDFDFLNPDYPCKAPGLLLSALATELRLQAGTEANSPFAAFDSSLAQLNDFVTDQPGEMKQVSIDHPLFDAVIGAFATACQIFSKGPDGQTGKVVLMLDTCEELTKLRPDNTVPDNVRVTFDALTSVHERANNVCVVFSGRRALASKGYGWTADSEQPQREFLRLFVVQGFTEQEARTFLSRFSLEDKALPREFLDPILDLTRSTSSDEESRFLITAPGETPEPLTQKDSRHNPYDVNMYAEWAVTSTDLTIEKMRSAGPHFYIEERIVRRLNAAIRRLLPQLALLGRFDRKLLEAIVGEQPDAARVLTEVTDQEWVRPDQAWTSDRWLIEARLRGRILNYYRDREFGELLTAQRLLADTLTAWTLERPLEELAEQYFIAAFEALQEDPERAAAWWGKVEERLVRENAWTTWGQALTAQLLAEPIFSSEAKSSFRAAVLATQASAIIHAAGDASATWQRAEAAFPAYPAATGRARLEFRIQCGVQVLFDSMPEPGPVFKDSQCRASWLAAAETLIERAERKLADAARRPAPLLRSMRDDQDPFLRAFTVALSARSFAMSGNTVRAAYEFEESIAQATGLETTQTWLDWRAPDNLRARVDLEFLRAAPDQWNARQKSSPDLVFLNTIDDDRLWSRISQDLETGPLAFEPVSILEKPLCNAHRQTPALAITLAEKGARNRPGEWLLTLRRYSESAKAAGMLEVSRDADRAFTRVIQRQRLMSENWMIPPALLESADPYDVWLCALTRGLHLSGTSLQELVKAFPDYTPELRVAELRVGETRSYAELLLMLLDTTLLRNSDTFDKALWKRTADAFRALGDMKGLIAEDKRGLLICALTEAAWRARTGKTLKETLGSLQALELPDCSWETVLDAAENDDPSFLANIDGGWRPWIVRALAVCCRAKHANPARHCSRIVTWLKTNQTIEIRGERVLPMELAFLERKLDWSDRIGNWIAVAFAVLILVGIASALLVFAWDVTKASWFDVVSGAPWWRNVLAVGGHIVAVAVVCVCTLLAIVGVTALVQQLLKIFGALGWTGSPIGLDYRIQMPPDADKNRPAAGAWSATLRQRILYLPTGWQTLAFTPPIPDEGQYLQLWKQRSVPLTGSASLGMEIFLSSKLRFDIRIAVDAASAGGPWETIFGIHNPKSDRFADIPCQFSRTVSTRALLAQADLLNPVNMTVWMYRGLGIDRATLTWQRKESGVRTRAIAVEVLNRTTEYEQVRYRTAAAQIYGSPIERSSEVFLGVGGVDPGDVAYWISPSEIQRRYPNLRLLIVQAPPAEMRERTPTDRLQAAQMKRFAAAAFECGIPAVLVLPPIPPNVTHEVQALFFDVLTKNVSNASHRLIALTRRLQDIVSSQPFVSQDVPFGLAFDICLYVEGRVNFRSREAPAIQATEASNV